MTSFPKPTSTVKLNFYSLQLIVLFTSLKFCQLKNFALKELGEQEGALSLYRSPFGRHIHALSLLYCYNPENAIN